MWEMFVIIVDIIKLINNMLDFQSTSCCGVDEIVDLGSRNTTRGAMLDVCNNYIRREWNNSFVDDFPAFLSFTGVMKYGYGQEFANFIRKNKLGTVRESVARVNPNSGNRIKMWIWAVNRTAMRKWYKDNK